MGFLQNFRLCLLAESISNIILYTHSDQKPLERKMIHLHPPLFVLSRSEEKQNIYYICSNNLALNFILLILMTHVDG